MANTSPKAERPAKKDATSPAKPVHRIKVNEVVLSVFPDARGTVRAPVQREYKTRDGKTGYADALRPEHWVDAITAMQRLIEWHGNQSWPQPEGDE